MRFHTTKKDELLAEQAALVEREWEVLDILVSSRDRAERAIAQAELDTCVARLEWLDIKLAEIVT